MEKNNLVTAQQTPIEIMLRIDGEGRTTAKALYEFLGLNSTNYTKWCKTNILNNQYAEKGRDYTVLVPQYENSRGGRPTTDYRLTASFAKKLAMASNSKRGEQARDYFIKVEEKLKNQVVAVEGNLSQELQMFKALFDHATKTELAIKEHGEEIQSLKDEVSHIKSNQDNNVVETYEMPVIERSNEQMLLSELEGQEAICFCTTDIARAFGLKGAVRLNQYLLKHGIIEHSPDGGAWQVTERYKYKGYTKYKTKRKNQRKYDALWWTERGALFIIEFLIMKGWKQKEPLRRSPVKRKKL